MDSIILPTDPSTGQDYRIWRKDVSIWQKLTEMPKNKQGLALQYVTQFDTRLHEVVMNIDPVKVESDNGFEIVLNVLDEYFNYDDRKEEIKLYDRLKTLKREEGQLVNDFMNEFDFLVMELQKYGNKFSETQLALRLMKTANITETQCEIIKASTPNFDYASIKQTMKRTFRNVTDVKQTGDLFYPGSKLDNNFQPTAIENFNQVNVKDGHQSNFKENVETMTLFDKSKLSLYDKKVTDFSLKSKSLYCEILVCDQKDTKSIPMNAVKNKHNNNSCDVCSQINKEECSALIDMPVCAVFNELLVIDIESYNGTSLLHLIDVFSNYSMTAVLHNHDFNEVKQNIYKYWIDIFGQPLRIVSNFNAYCISNELKATFEAKDINFSVLSTETSWCNNLCKQNHQTIAQSVDDIMRLGECSLNIAVIWAVNDKNSAKSVNGFSPAQLIFGFNPLLPCIKATKPFSPYHGFNKDTIMIHLESLISARKLFVKGELSGLYRRKLNYKCPNYENVRFFQGDEVLYRPDHNNHWLGPAIVIGHNEEFALINHQNKLIRTHPFHLKLVKDSEIQVMREVLTSINEQVCVHVQDKKSDTTLSPTDKYIQPGLDTPENYNFDREVEKEERQTYKKDEISISSKGKSCRNTPIRYPQSSILPQLMIWQLVLQILIFVSNILQMVCLIFVIEGFIFWELNYIFSLYHNKCSTFTRKIRRNSKRNYMNSVSQLKFHFHNKEKATKCQWKNYPQSLRAITYSWLNISSFKKRKVELWECLFLKKRKKG